MVSEMLRWIIVIFCGLVLRAADLPAQVAVIAHPSVPADTISRSRLLDYYTGDRTTWSNGGAVVVFDLEPKTDVKNVFYKFLGKSTSRMKSIWLKKKLSGEGGPPESFPSEQEVLEKVASTPGAIGFVNSGNVQGTVKTLTIISAE